MRQILDWFRTGPAIAPEVHDTATTQRVYRKSQWRIFLSLLFGYAFFYTCRLSLSVAKKPMLDAGIVTVEELGFIGSALYFSYAFGKLTNGFLADYANIRKMMSFGLGASALLNLLFGAMENASFFALIWGINGWFQSMGSAPSAVSIFQWFEPSRRGRFYGAWAGSHNIGEGISFMVTTGLVAALGWRVGFIAPGLMCCVMAVVLFFSLSDRPAAEGMLAPGVAFGEPEQLTGKKSSIRTQLSILKMPVLWQLGIACALMYIARYAINSWGVLYLETVKGYSTVDAGFAVGVYPILGLAGAVFSGAISDKFFSSDRHLTTVLYGFCNVGGMGLLFYGPGGAYDLVGLGIFGFGIGGLIVFLGGLTAAEYCPREAVGAVKGLIGLFSYLATAAGEVIGSRLIVVTGSGVDATYDFDRVITFWMAIGAASILVALSVKVTAKK
jgi:OPA family sugar phosphate sensor protein UhpC-like MFS transporter